MYMRRTDIDRDTWPLWAHLRRRRGGPPHRLAGAYVAQRVHIYPYSSWIPVCLFARAVRAKRNSGHDRSNRITSRSICLCIHIDMNPYRPWWYPFWASRGLVYRPISKHIQAFFTYSIYVDISKSNIHTCQTSQPAHPLTLTPAHPPRCQPVCHVHRGGKVFLTEQSGEKPGVSG